MNKNQKIVFHYLKNEVGILGSSSPFQAIRSITTAPTGSILNDAYMNLSDKEEVKVLSKFVKDWSKNEKDQISVV